MSPIVGRFVTAWVHNTPTLPGGADGVFRLTEAAVGVPIGGPVGGTYIGNIDTSRSGLNFSGTETVPLHVNLTPAIYLGVPR